MKRLAPAILLALLTLLTLPCWSAQNDWRGVLDAYMHITADGEEITLGMGTERGHENEVKSDKRRYGYRTALRPADRERNWETLSNRLSLSLNQSTH
jgi:hypothetical protein